MSGIEEALAYLMQRYGNGQPVGEMSPADIINTGGRAAMQFPGDAMAGLEGALGPAQTAMQSESAGDLIKNGITAGVTTVPGIIQGLRGDRNAGGQAGAGGGGGGGQGDLRIESLGGGGPSADLGPALDQIQGGASSPSPDLQGDMRIEGLGGGGPTSQPDARIESLSGGNTTAPANAIPLPDNQYDYTIQPGDSLSLIGAMFGVTYDELIAANDEISGKQSVIHPGQRLLIPSPAGRGTEERAGVADKGMKSAAEGEAYSRERRKG